MTRSIQTLASVVSAVVAALTGSAEAVADGIEDPPAAVRASLNRAYGCVSWDAPVSARRAFCNPGPSSLQPLILWRSARGAVESVEFSVPIDLGSSPSPLWRALGETEGRTRAAYVVSSLLPRWREGPRWIRGAIRSLSRDEYRMRAIRVGNVTVLVQRTEGAVGRADDPYGGTPPQAVVTLTRSSNLEQFNQNATYGTWRSILADPQRGRSPCTETAVVMPGFRTCGRP